MSGETVDRLRDIQLDGSSTYRTPEEYIELFAPLLGEGFSVTKQEFRPDTGDHYSDTGRHHFILRR